MLTASPYAVVASALVLFVAGLGTGYKVESWRMNAQLASYRAESAEQKTVDADEALKQFKDSANIIHGAAEEAASAVSDARAKIRATQVRPYAVPLPTDCAPDTERLQRRDAAIDAYNAARSGSNAGSGLPGSTTDHGP